MNGQNITLNSNVLIINGNSVSTGNVQTETRRKYTLEKKKRSRLPSYSTAENTEDDEEGDQQEDKIPKKKKRLGIPFYSTVGCQEHLSTTEEIEEQTDEERCIEEHRRHGKPDRRTQEKKRKHAEPEITSHHEETENKRCRILSNQHLKEILSGKTFAFLAKKLSPADWLLLHCYLEIEFAVVSQYSADLRNTRSEIVHCLNYWKNNQNRQNSPLRKQIKLLFDSLERCGRKDLSDELRQMDPESQDIPVELQSVQVTRELLKNDQFQMKEDIRVKVLKKSKRQFSYKGKEKNLTYFNIIGGFISNKTQKNLITIVNYDSDFERIKVGHSYQFKNLIRKNDQLWAVTGSVTVRVRGLSEDFKCDMMLPEEEPKRGLPRTLPEAVNTRRFSVITGKVFKNSGVKYVKDGTLAVRNLGLFDKQGIAKLTLFGKLATMKYKKNEIIESNYIFGTEYKGRVQIQATEKSEMFNVTGSDLEILSPPTGAFDDDDDFKPSFPLDTFTIEGIQKAEMYDACTNPGCKRKKFVGGLCPKCDGCEKGKTCRVVLSLIRSDGSETKATLFEDTVSTLFKISEFKNEDDLMKTIPESFSAILRNAKLSNIRNIVY